MVCVRNFYDMFYSRANDSEIGKPNAMYATTAIQISLEYFTSTITFEGHVMKEVCGLHQLHPVWNAWDAHCHETSMRKRTITRYISVCSSTDGLKMATSGISRTREKHLRTSSLRRLVLRSKSSIETESTT